MSFFDLVEGLEGCDVYSKLMDQSMTIEIFIDLFEDNPANFVSIMVHQYPIDFEDGLKMKRMMEEIVGMKKTNKDQFRSFFDEYREQKLKEMRDEEERKELERVQEEKMREMKQREDEERRKKREEEEKEQQRILEEEEKKREEIISQFTEFNSHLIDLQVSHFKA